jgi:hypothetical protein
METILYIVVGVSTTVVVLGFWEEGMGEWRRRKRK